MLVLRGGSVVVGRSATDKAGLLTKLRMSTLSYIDVTFWDACVRDATMSSAEFIYKLYVRDGNARHCGVYAMSYRVKTAILVIHIAATMVHFGREMKLLSLW